MESLICVVRAPGDRPAAPTPIVCPEVKRLSPPRIRRAIGANAASGRRATCCGVVALLGAALAGCGGVTGGRVDPGYPTAYPRVTRVTTLQTRLNGDVVRFAAPAGWGLARIDSDEGARPAFVRLDGDCYLSVSITGSSTRTLAPAAIALLYAKPSGDYTWRVTRAGSAIIALLGDQNSATGVLSRSSLGSVYLPTSRHAYLAIDFGAGIWPLHGRACPDSAVAADLPMLTSASQTILGGAVLVQ